MAWDMLSQEPGCVLSKTLTAHLSAHRGHSRPLSPVVYKNPVDGAAGAFLSSRFTILRSSARRSVGGRATGNLCEHKNWPYPSDALIELAERFPQPIVACFIGSVKKMASDQARLHDAGVPTYVMPEDAALGLKALLRMHDRQSDS